MLYRHPTLFSYQEGVKQHIVKTPYTGIFLGMGFGKTLITLSALSQIRPVGHILVVAPKTIARSTWTGEIEKYNFPIRTKSLIVDEKDKKLSRADRLARYAEVFTDEPTMYFINHNLLDDLLKNMPTFKVKGQRKPVVQWPFATVIVDESQVFKNHASVKFKALNTVRPAIQRLIELTGTPIPNGLIDLWSQVYLLDQGKALGENITWYKRTFFDVEKYVNDRPVAWIPKPGAEQEIYRRVQHLVMSAINTDIQLPPTTITPVYVTLPHDVLQAYKDFKKTMVLDGAIDKDNPFEILAPNAGVLRAKLLQFASGTIYVDDKGTYVTVHQEKLEMLDYILSANSRPTIVAYHFKSDRIEIPKFLRERGHNVEVFDGSTEMLARWNRKEIDVLLLQPASAGHGLNFQFGGSTLIWYTLPDSSERYEQANHRLIRIGQVNPVDIYVLLSRSTWDLKQPLMLDKKYQNQKRLLDAVTRHFHLDVENEVQDEDLIKQALGVAA